MASWDRSRDPSLALSLRGFAVEVETRITGEQCEDVAHLFKAPRNKNWEFRPKLFAPRTKKFGSGCRSAAAGPRVVELSSTCSSRYSPVSGV